MIANEIVTVTTGVTLICRGGGGPNDLRPVAVLADTANNIWVGGVDVTTATGIPLSSASSPASFELSVSENLYGISTITNATCRVMAGRAGVSTEVGN